jgi:hypothetical protein
LEFHPGGAIGFELMGNVPLGILLRGKRIRDRHPISVAAVPDHVPLAILGILCDFVLLSHFCFLPCMIKEYTKRLCMSIAMPVQNVENSLIASVYAGENLFG